MFKLLLGIIVFFVLILLLAGSLGISLLRLLFGFGNKINQQQPESTQTTSNKTDKDKVFGKQEGEYVEFEEVKEEDNQKL